MLLQAINLGSGFAAIIVVAAVLILPYATPLLGTVEDGSSDATENRQAPSDPTPAASPIPTVRPTATPATALSADELIAMVKSSGYTEERDEAAFEAAKALVNRGEYDKAIEVAPAAFSSEIETEIEAYVARRAIVDGLFTTGLKAASRIYPPAQQDIVELEVISAVEQAAVESSISEHDLIHGYNPNVPSLDEMMQATNTGGTYEGEDRELQKIVGLSVWLGRYDTAIQAASDIFDSEVETQELIFITRCAVEEGQFRRAREAATEIANSDDKGRMIAEVMRAITHSETLGFSPIYDPPSTSCRLPRPSTR